MEDAITNILNNKQYMINVILDKEPVDMSLFIGKESPYNNQIVQDLYGIKLYFLSYLLETSNNSLSDISDINKWLEENSKFNKKYDDVQESVSFKDILKDHSLLTLCLIFFVLISGLGLLPSYLIYLFLLKLQIGEVFSLIITTFLTTFVCASITYSMIAEQIVQNKLTEAKNKIKSIFDEQLSNFKNIQKNINNIDTELNSREQQIKEKESEINQLENIKNNLFTPNVPEYPWLAKLYADLHYIHDEETAKYLSGKKNPAIKASQEVSKIAKEKRELLEKCKMLEYQLNYYEKVFPWLEDFKEVDAIETYNTINNFDDTETDEYTKLKNWLSPEEYQKLSSTEKYQLALDRYKNRNNKTNWEVGIEYERYIGYLYETKGYKVTYNGALEGLNDFGRDIIAEDKNKILVVQCKYWKKEKTIHEKHIFQLYGTMVLKKITTRKKVCGVFITSATLSDTAKQVAKELNIEVVENKKMDKNYPCVKCNINRQTSERIYHLPFDQQYDKILIEPQKGEKYVNTIKEAEELGFRRASKWITTNN